MVRSQRACAAQRDGLDVRQLREPAGDVVEEPGVAHAGIVAPAARQVPAILRAARTIAAHATGIAGWVGS